MKQRLIAQNYTAAIEPVRGINLVKISSVVRDLNPDLTEEEILVVSQQTPEFAAISRVVGDFYSIR